MKIVQADRPAMALRVRHLERNAEERSVGPPSFVGVDGEAVLGEIGVAGLPDGPVRGKRRRELLHGSDLRVTSPPS